MSALAKLIGPKLKQKRLEFGFTIEFMAEILDCSRQLIEHYEKGYCEMPLDRLSEFSKLCDLPIDWFFLDEQSILIFLKPLNQKRRRLNY